MGRPRFGESDEEFDARTRRPNPWFMYIALALILSCCGAIIYPVWLGARAMGPASRALSNVKQCAIGVEMYESDADDRTPFAAVWMDSVLPYVHDETCFHSPELSPDEYGYAFRRSLSGIPDAKIRDLEHTAMIFDSTDGRRNANGGLELLPRPPRNRHGGGSVNVVAFADGNVRFVPQPGVVLK